MAVPEETQPLAKIKYILSDKSNQRAKTSANVKISTRSDQRFQSGFSD